MPLLLHHRYYSGTYSEEFERILPLYSVSLYCFISFLLFSLITLAPGDSTFKNFCERYILLNLGHEVNRIPCDYGGRSAGVSQLFKVLSSSFE